MSYIQKGTKEFRLASIVLFAGGFNTFAILYCTQPLMPFLYKASWYMHNFKYKFIF